MHPKQIKEALGVAVDIKRPAFVWGPPGIGKSDVVAQLAEETDRELRDVRLNLLDPTDVKGFPVPDTLNGVMKWLPANFFPPMAVLKGKGKSGTMVPNDSKGILFLDELNQAPPMVQAAAYQLLLTGQVGDYKLPVNWSLLAAGNRETDRANAQRMPSALALRMIHLDMEANPDDWCEWAMKNHASVPVELLTFIRFRPDLLHNFDPSRRVSPNPRSWVFCGDMTNRDMSPEVKFAMMQGTVGDAEAGEYHSYLGMFRDLPSVDQVKLDPDGTIIPENVSAKFGITGALAKATTKDSYPRFKKYIDRMDPEWQVVYTRDAMTMDRSITTTREFQAFAVNHSHLLA